MNKTLLNKEYNNAMTTKNGGKTVTKKQNIVKRKSSNDTTANKVLKYYMYV